MIARLSGTGKIMRGNVNAAGLRGLHSKTRKATFGYSIMLFPQHHHQPSLCLERVHQLDSTQFPLTLAPLGLLKYCCRA